MCFVPILSIQRKINWGYGEPVPRPTRSTAYTIGILHKSVHRSLFVHFQNEDITYLLPYH